MNSTDKTVEILLADFYVATHNGKTYADIRDGDIDQKEAESTKKELDQHYKELFLEIIGSDEKPDDDYGQDRDTRNELRAELRQRVEDRFNG